MSLEELAKKYRENIKSFVTDSDILKIMYETQYKDKYDENKQESKEFKQTIEDIEYIPYITLEQIEEFFQSYYRLGLDEKYIKETFPELYEIEEELKDKRKKIIEKSTITLLEDIDQIAPDLRYFKNDELLQSNYKYIKANYGEVLAKVQNKYNISEQEAFERIMPKKVIKNLEYKQMLKICSKDDFNANAEMIRKKLKVCNLQNDLKKFEIDSNINKFKRYTEETIIKNTSTYLYNMTQIGTKGKNYSNDLSTYLYKNSKEFNFKNKKKKYSFINDINNDKSYIIFDLSRNPENNKTCIFLPVLTFKSKSEYLHAIVHEVGHASKGKISNNKKRHVTGLLERKLYANKSLDLKNKKMYSLEETMHEWQMKKITKEIWNSEKKLANLLEMPYTKMQYIDIKNPGMTLVYKNFNDDSAKNITEEIMKRCETFYQEDNYQKTAGKSMKKHIGKGLFRKLANLYNNWLEDFKNKPEKFGFQVASKQLDKVHGNIDTSSQEKYEGKGQKIIEKIDQKIQKEEKKNTRKAKLSQILKKTFDKVKPNKIISMGEILEEKVKEIDKSKQQEELTR